MAFAKPDMTFTPGSFANTGVQYLDQYYNTVKSNVAMLKQKGVLPFARVQLSRGLCCGVLSMTRCLAGTRVLLAVGGATYQKWSAKRHCCACSMSAPVSLSQRILSKHCMTVRRAGLNNGAIAAFVADMGFSGALRVAQLTIRSLRHEKVKTLRVFVCCRCGH